jgi:hypothetical protein
MTRITGKCLVISTIVILWTAIIFPAQASADPTRPVRAHGGNAQGGTEVGKNPSASAPKARRIDPEADVKIIQEESIVSYGAD